MAAKTPVQQYALLIETSRPVTVSAIRQNLEREKKINVVRIERLQYTGTQKGEVPKNMKKDSLKKLFDAIKKAPKELQSELKEAANELMEIDEGLEEMVEASKKRDELIDELATGQKEVRGKISDMLKRVRESNDKFGDGNHP